MSVSQLGYVGIGVKNMDAWEEYAKNLLGFEISETGSDGTVYLRFDDLHHRISLVPTGSDDLEFVGWQTRDLHAFQTVKRNLLDNGIEWEQGSPEQIEHRKVTDLVKFSMSGIATEVFYGPLALPETPFNSSIGITGFKTDHLGLGLIALRVDDPERATIIMRECLGFEVSDIVERRDVFLYCNLREHTALIRPYKGKGKRMDHLRIELDSLDDVGFTLDRANEHFSIAHSSLGKQTSSRSISFYMETPSNFPIQYGWGSDEINPKDRRVKRHDRSRAWGHRGL